MKKQLEVIYTLACAFTSIQKVNIARGVEQMNSNIRSEHVLETSFGVIVFASLVMRTPYARKK
ncbi:hypothetical protein T12_6622 [Trichinella patagoniensis]|uniref:Uncharacterized protein n=1 Tax=Trichinella patagoniensis TaxID=990121 RepID=A0A0V0ZSS5_9BILA|nr:hypothetical protein T12_6622 [Trichinella patagoniensis]